MRYFKRAQGIFASGLWAILAVGCGGGSGMSSLQSGVLSQSSTHVAQSAQTAAANVWFDIGIRPKARPGVVQPRYVSPSTQSLQVLVDGAKAIIVNLTPQSPNCSPNPAVSGAYVCSASLSVPTGSHVFTVTTYDLTAGKGNVLSTNSTGPVTVKPTGTTTISLVLQGQVKYVLLALAPTNPPLGAAAAIGLTATLEDADQNLIIGPAPYEYAVTLTTSNATAGPLSKGTLKSPADADGITVNYSGANVAAITYSATATGLSAANVSDATLTPGASAWNETVLYTFDAGSSPTGLVETGGAFYGAINSGSIAGCCGAIFALLPPAAGQTPWMQRVVHAFTGGADGNTPTGVIADARGTLYGTTQSGAYEDWETGDICNGWGLLGCGTVFQITSPSTTQSLFATLYSFQGFGDGGNPNGGLTMGAHGALYGTTVVGGSPETHCAYGEFQGCGVLFQLTPPAAGQTVWTESVLRDLAYGEFGTIANIFGLIADANGVLYALSSENGDCGSVIAMEAQWWSYSFSGGFDGCYTGATLALDDANNLYVANTTGGAYGKGVVFKLTAGGATSMLHSFGATPADGVSPALSNRADARGALYGTAAGGPSGGGTVFRLDPPAAGKTAWSESVLHAFNGHADGANPTVPLSFGTNGTIYGFASGGGKGSGVAFALTAPK